MARIKICGLQRKRDVIAVNKYLPDYAGFVFANSHRQVTIEQARRLKSLLLPEVIAVGVFVDEEISRIVEIVKEGIVDAVQLHGGETASYISSLRRVVGDTMIIKAMRIKEEIDIQAVRESKADFLLFDSFSVREYGGSGKSFDWECLREVERPFFLAGGVDETKLKAAFMLENIYAVDVSSAVETDGYKDEEKIKSIVEAVRGME